MNEWRKGQCLVEQVISRGEKQTQLFFTYPIHISGMSVRRIQPQILEVDGNVRKNHSVVTAKLQFAVELADKSGVIIESFFDETVSELLRTEDSREGMKIYILPVIERCSYEIFATGKFKVMVIIKWLVVITMVSVCCCCSKSVFEENGVMEMKKGLNHSQSFNMMIYSTCTVMIQNEGVEDVAVWLEGSPDGINFFQDTKVIIIKEKMEVLVPKYFAKYVRIAGEALEKGQMRYWIQAKG